MDAEPSIEYVGMGILVGGGILLITTLFTETVMVGDVTVGLALAGDGLIVVGLAFLTVHSFLYGGKWWYLPLLVMMSGRFLLTLTGPTATDPLETVGFAMVLVGCATLAYLGWQHRDESTVSG